VQVAGAYCGRFKPFVTTALTMQDQVQISCEAVKQPFIGHSLGDRKGP
jgi:hypothetical protein